MISKSGILLKDEYIFLRERSSCDFVSTANLNVGLFKNNFPPLKK